MPNVEAIELISWYCYVNTTIYANLHILIVINIAIIESKQSY